MRYSDMVAEFNARAIAGVVNLKTKRKQQITSASVESILSTVRQTFVFLLAYRLRIALPEAEVALQSMDLRPYLSLLEEAAGKRAHIENHAAPRNARNHVRRFLRVTFPQQFARPRSNGGDVAVPASWTPLLEAVEKAWLHPQTRRQYRSDVARMARVLFAAGYESPQTMPDRATIEDLMRKSGFAPNTIDSAFNAYRGVHRYLASTGNPTGAKPIIAKVGPQEIGVRSLPIEAFAGLPAGATPTEMVAEQLLPYLAPGFARAWMEWKAGVGNSRRPATRSDVLRSLSVVSALLYRRPELLVGCEPTPPPLTSLLPTHLFELRYTEAVAPSLAGGDSLVSLALQDGVKDAALGGNSTLKLVLMNRIIDALAKQARLSSPITATGDFYPASAIKIAESLWMLVADLCKDGFMAQAPERWEAMRAQYHRLWQRMDTVNQQANRVGSKDKRLLVRTITLPQLVCIALPRLAAHVRLLEQKCDRLDAGAVAKGHDPAKHPTCKKARAEWEDRLEEYLALAIFTVDPLRNKNHAFAWLGADAEVRPALEVDALGRPTRITQVETFFSGSGGANPDASFKIPQARDRLWRWAPAWVDFHLLLRYLAGPRLNRIDKQRLLVDASGVPVTRDTYRLQGEIAGEYVLATQPDGDRPGPFRHLALFVSPEAATPFGGFDPNKLSDLYGRGLYAACRLLGSSVPTTYAATKTGRWRGLFAAHVARLLWSTYWLGIREYSGPRTNETTVLTGVQIAIDGTTDSERTLRDEYTEVEAEMRNRQRDEPGDFQHPNSFDGWMDRGYLLKPIDWAAEEVPLPATLVPTVIVAPHHMRQARRSKSRA